MGPYRLTSWPVNDVVYSGDFNSLDALIDSMNIWDPMGNWQYSERGPFIEGGAPGNQYGQMDAIVQGTTINSFLMYQSLILQRGISTKLGAGDHLMTIQNPKTFCEDTLLIVVSCAQPDTMQITIHP